MLGGLVAANIAAWIWAWTLFRDHPSLLAAAGLAFVFGLRHAVDADHIAAIDNVTRRLVQEGKRPIGVGLFFSLGHSTVVALACLLMVLASRSLQAEFEVFHRIGGVVGTLVSAGFLFLIAIANLDALVAVGRMLRQARQGRPVQDAELEGVLAQRGLLGRLLKRLVGFVSSSWRMYPLGFLFGLSFDTATEVGLLGLAAAHSAEPVPALAIMVFPLLFAAGMSFVDSVDSVLMLNAYSWAFVSLERKLRYNFAVTLISVAAAMFIGSLEVASLVADHFELSGPGWRWAQTAAGHSGLAGLSIVAGCVAAWLVAVAAFRMRRSEPEPN